MNTTNASALMHAVLDGEATPSEAADLERELDQHPELRAQYAALQNLFEELLRVPMGYPPEGLVASVMANIPQNRPESSDEDQLFAGPGVLGASSQGTRGHRRDGSKAGRTEFQPWLRRKDKDMSEQNRTFPGNRKLWIGGGIAAAVVVIGLASGLIPPGGKDTAGTIVPAQRYQAPQSNVQDVQGGGVAGAPGQTTATATKAAEPTANANGVSGDRNGLSGDRNGLSGDRNGLSGDRNGLSGDRNGLSGDRNGLSGDRNGLSGDRNGLSGDRNGLSGDRNGLSGDRNGLSGDRNGLSGDRNGLSGDRNGLSGDRNGLSGDRNGLSGDRNTLNGDRNGLSGDRNVAQ